MTNTVRFGAVLMILTVIYAIWNLPDSPPDARAIEISKIEVAR